VRICEIAMQWQMIHMMDSTSAGIPGGHVMVFSVFTTELQRGGKRMLSIVRHSGLSRAASSTSAGVRR
jgi:hypothetical protein